VYYQDEDDDLYFDGDLADLLSSIEIEVGYEQAQDVDIDPGEMSILFQQCTL